MTQERFSHTASPIAHLLQFFKYSHLPDHLKDVSRPFAEFANELAFVLPMNPETTVALRKLLEAKDAAVRSVLCAEAPVYRASVFRGSDRSTEAEPQTEPQTEPQPQTEAEAEAEPQARIECRQRFPYKSDMSDLRD